MPSRDPSYLVRLLRQREGEREQAAVLADAPSVVPGSGTGEPAVSPTKTAESIEARTADPSGADLYVGRVWMRSALAYVYDGAVARALRYLTSKITALEIDSTGSFNGDVLASNGSGGALWVAPSGGGGGGGGGGASGSGLLPLGQPQGTLLRSYDFQDGTVQGFTTDVGTLSVVGTRLRLTSTAANASALEPSTAADVADGEVEFDVVAGTGNDYGVIFRATDANNHYMVRVGAQMEFFRKVAGVYTGLGVVGNRAFGTGTTSRVLIRFIGDLIEFYLNESLMATLRNSQFTTGRVGVRGTGNALYTDFDNIKVYSLAAGYRQKTIGSAVPIWEQVWQAFDANTDPIDALITSGDYRVLIFFGSHNAASWKAATNAVYTVPAGKRAVFVEGRIGYAHITDYTSRRMRLWNVTDGAVQSGFAETDFRDFIGRSLYWAGDVAVASRLSQIPAGKQVRLEMWNSDTVKRAMGALLIFREVT